MIRAVTAFCLLLAIGAAATARERGLPRHIGECAATRVRDVESRLGADEPRTVLPHSGSAVRFTNGGYQVSYEWVPAVEASRSGDPVRMCLVAIPRHCPPGDNRGREYRVANLRTHQSWRLPDAEHMCGGA